MIPIVKINNYDIACMFRDRLKTRLRNPVTMEDENNGSFTIFIDENDFELARIIIQEVTQELKDEEQARWAENMDAWASNGRNRKPGRSPRVSGESLLDQIKGAGGPLTLSVAAVCAAIYLLFFFIPESLLNYLSAAGFSWSEPASWYRLVTPVFLHFGFAHLGFNVAIWIWAGGRIEKALGRGPLAALFFLGSVIPDYAQMHISGPNFGGMSGLVFALISFCWIAGVLNPKRYGAVQLPPGLMIFTVCFALLGLADILPGMSMANAVHIAGIVIGLLFGAYMALFVGGRRLRLEK